MGKPEDAPPLFIPEFLNNKLWHIPFNRVNDELIVDMVNCNADASYRYEFAIQGRAATLPNYAITTTSSCTPGTRTPCAPPSASTVPGRPP